MTPNALVAAASGDYAIPLSALIVSAAALVYGILRGVSTTREGIEKAMNDRINDLVRQIAELKEENAECERRARALAKALALLEDGGRH